MPRLAEERRTAAKALFGRLGLLGRLLLNVEQDLPRLDVIEGKRAAG